MRFIIVAFNENQWDKFEIFERQLVRQMLATRTTTNQNVEFMMVWILKSLYNL